MTLDPSFLRVPETILASSSVPFDELGEVSLAIGGEELVAKAAAVVALSTSASVLLTSSETTPVLPFVFLEFPSPRSTGMDFNRGKASIPSLPFSTSPIEGDVPSPSLHTRQPVNDVPLSSVNQT